VLQAVTKHMGNPIHNIYIFKQYAALKTYKQPFYFVQDQHCNLQTTYLTLQGLHGNLEKRISLYKDSNVT
jgi:hypothetical protein